MPSVERKSAPKSRKKKNAGPRVSPDELYLRSLDEAYYVPKRSREDITSVYMDRIFTAIKAFTLAQPPIDAETLGEREQEIYQKITTSLPLVVVPLVVRSLGLTPTEQQLRQIAWLVMHDGKEEQGVEETPKPRGRHEKQRRRSLTGCAKEGITLDAMMNTSLSTTLADAFAKGKELLADRKKLEVVLIDILKTGLLVFNPVDANNNNRPASGFCPLVSVVTCSDQEALYNVFDIFWLGTRKQVCKDGTRLIFTEDLKRLLDTVTRVHTGSEPPMTQEELDAFFCYVCDMGCDTIREDTFALAAE